MGDQIEMSTAENIFGSVSKFLTPQNSPRPTFSFNIGVVGRTPNSSWTPFNLMMDFIAQVVEIVSLVFIVV